MKDNPPGHQAANTPSKEVNRQSPRSVIGLRADFVIVAVSGLMSVWVCGYILSGNASGEGAWIPSLKRSLTQLAKAVLRVSLLPGVRDELAAMSLHGLPEGGKSQERMGSSRVGILSAVEYARLLSSKSDASKIKLLYQSRNSGAYLVSLSGTSHQEELAAQVGRWFPDLPVALQSLSQDGLGAERDPREPMQWYAEDWLSQPEAHFPFELDQRHPVLQLERAGVWLGPGALAALASGMGRGACERHAPVTARSWSMQTRLSDFAAIKNQKSMTSQNRTLSIGFLMHDGGVDGEHPDLQGLLERVHPFGEGAADKSRLSHGTHAAGIVAAYRNRVGIAGVAPGHPILGFTLPNASLGNASLSDVIAGLAEIWIHLDAATLKHQPSMHVLLLGYAMEASAPEHGEPLKIVLGDLVREHNILIVAPSGNIRFPRRSTSTVFLPADFAAEINGQEGRGFLLPVGASDVCSRPAWFSHTAEAGDGRYYFAPGYAIYSTLPQNDYGFQTGTSSAAAIAAGVAVALGGALNATESDTRTVRQLASFMLDSARPMAFSRPIYALDARNAVERLFDQSADADQPEHPQALAPLLNTLAR